MPTTRDEEVAKRFGANLKLARIDERVSQEEVGDRASLHRTEIGLLERGERIPRIDTLVKLADAVGVSPEELLAGISWTRSDATQAGRFAIAPQEGGPLDQTR